MICVLTRVDDLITVQFFIHGIFNHMGLINTRLVAWVNFSAGQATGIHGIFNYMIVHPEELTQCWHKLCVQSLRVPLCFLIENAPSTHTGSVPTQQAGQSHRISVSLSVNLSGQDRKDRQTGQDRTGKERNTQRRTGQERQTEKDSQDLCESVRTGLTGSL